MIMRLKAKKSSQIIIYGMILYVCIIQLLLSAGFPHFLIFILDILNLVLFFKIAEGRQLARILNNHVIKIHIIVYTVGILAAAVNLVNPVLVLWALRNNLRFVIFLGACILYLDEKDIDNIFNILNILFYINFIVFFIQYFVLGLRGDYLGGLFGTEKGANAYLNIFLIIISIKAVTGWINNIISTKSTVMVTGISLFESAVAELKVFFVEIIIIITLIVFISCIINNKIRTFAKGLIIVIMGIFAVSIGLEVLYEHYPNFANFFSVENMIGILTDETNGYSHTGDLNRFTALKTINRVVFSSDNIIERIFGIGLGGAEYSTSSDLLVSAFYNKFAYLHYYWFSAPWMYLECGYVGVVLYIIAFIYAGIQSTLYIILKKDKRNIENIVIGAVMCFLTPILYIYNQSMRIECAYLMYFCISAIYVRRGKSGRTS